MKYFILIFITMTFFSCNEKDLPIKNKNIKKIFNKDSITTIIGYKYSDTISNNITGEGIIKYNLKYAGIPSNIFERRIHLYLSTHLDKNTATFKEIEENVQGVFFDTIGNGVFNFRFNFKKPGERILNLAFEDIIFYGNHLNSKDTILKVKYSILALPLFVVDSTLIIGTKDKNIYFEQDDIFKIKRKDSAKLIRENQRKIDSMKRVLNN